MPITAKVVNKTLVLTWASEDQTTEASFKIPPTASDEETLAMLTKAVRFMRAQMPTTDTATDAEQWTPTTMTPVATASTVTPPPSDAIRIPMLSPAAMSDKPSDGGPPRDGFNWGDLPTTTIPPQLAANPEHGWEMIPPGEM